MLSVPEHKLLLRQSRQLMLSQAPAGTISDSAILIEMQAAGLCGTDIAMLSGSRLCHAEVLGHEGIGIVLSSPENAGLPKGTRVIVNPVHRSHPECVIGHSRDGVFRELFWLESSEVAQSGFLVRCPDGCHLESIELALAEPVASVLYSLKLLREQKHTTSLLIRGSGTIAVIAAKLWAANPASKAVLVSKSEAHARMLREITPRSPNVEILSLEASDITAANRNFRSAILCCSREDAPEGLRFLMDTANDGATIDLMAGFPADYNESRLDGVALDRIRWNNICGVQSAPPTPVPDQKTGKTFTLVGHRGTSERQILDAVDLLSNRVISLADVPHCSVSLEDLPSVVRDIFSPTRLKNGWVKAMIDFRQHSNGDRDALA